MCKNPSKALTFNMPTWVSDWAFSTEHGVSLTCWGYEAGTARPVGYQHVYPAIADETLVLHGRRLSKVTQVYEGHKCVGDIDGLLGESGLTCAAASVC